MVFEAARVGYGDSWKTHGNDIAFGTEKRVLRLWLLVARAFASKGASFRRREYSPGTQNEAGKHCHESRTP
jgi:hypothetical protein